MAKKIADISHYQGNIDWTQARNELAFIIFRASVGSNADKKYLEYTRDCGVPYGAYHYVKAGTAEAARTEARWFVECANKAAAKPLIYFADIEYETHTAATTEAVCIAFLEELKALGCGRVGLYIGQSRYPYAGRAITLCDAMWIPRYGKNTGDVPGEEYYPKYPCDLWQYTSVGRVAGISGDVDLDILHGSKTLEWFTEGAEVQGTTKEEVMMGYDPQKVISIARAEVGYLEKKSNKDLDDKTANAGDKNYTKYARDMDAINGFYNGKKQGVAWCDIFVDWCFVQAYGIDEGRALLCQPLKSCGAGCKYSRNYYKAKGRLFDSPQPGDQIFFYPSDGIGGSAIAHTGLVGRGQQLRVHHRGQHVQRERRCRQRRVRAREEVQAQLQPHRRLWPPELRRARNHHARRDPAGAGTAGESPAETAPVKSVLVTGGSVNVRLGNGTEFAKVSTVYKGAILEWIATAANGWHAVLYKKQVVWISGKYTELREATV